MSTDSNTVSEPTIFSAVITPNRSLDRVGFIVLMSLVSFVSFVGGLVFFIAGAWPVVGFFGLDVALLYWAFKLNYARAAAYEEVTVTAAELEVAQGEPHAARSANARSTRSGPSSTVRRMPISACSACSWSRAGAGFRSPISSGRRSAKALPRRCPAA